MSIEFQAANWLWKEYGKSIADKAFGEIKRLWSEFKWKDAELNYRYRIIELYNTTRLLGHPKPISITGIYTDVYVLDKLTAFRRFDLASLQSNQIERDLILSNEDGRKPALEMVSRHKRIFILGKPGAGKTTFLKYLTLQTCIGEIKKTPIFVSLREWSDSGLDLISYMCGQFDICSFPEPRDFIENLLEKGNALVLFDGLDEVNEEQDKRINTIKMLTNFSQKYRFVHICLTCRIAATDYSFDQFEYLEIADFSQEQIKKFVEKWYVNENVKYNRFIEEFEKPEHDGLRELARTPLLLTLLCLAFDETMYFPVRRSDLYKEAFDALLKKWDSSRGIHRDEIYKNLSPIRKEQLLARVAAQNFENGKYFIKREIIAEQISNYLKQLPNISDSENLLDGDVILKSIEAQHGLLIERARGIYSFSHLTFQEYLTSRYIIENAGRGTIKKLIQNHFFKNHWREIILLTVSILDNADIFFENVCESLEILTSDSKLLQSVLLWSKQQRISQHKTTPLDFITQVTSGTMWLVSDYIERAINIANSKVETKSIKLDPFRNIDDPTISHEIDRALNRTLYRSIAKEIERTKIQTFNEIIDMCYALATRYSSDKISLKNIVRLRELSLLVDQAVSKQNIRELKRLISRIRGTNYLSMEIFSEEVSSEELDKFLLYIRGCQLYLDCLSIATVTDRKRLEASLFKLL